ncbi:MFS transporter [Garicola koreensis]
MEAGQVYGDSVSTPDEGPEKGSTVRVMFALLLPLFAALMSVSSIMVALPAIEDGLGAGSSDLQWVLTGYTLAFGVGMVPAGRAGDLWGRRRIFLAGVIVFGLSSLAAALSPTPLMLNILRVVMGLGASMLVPQIIGMIQRLFTGSARGRAYGLMSTAIGLAVAVGPLVGGGLIDLAGGEHAWRMVFLVNIPVVAAGLVFAMLWLPTPHDTDAEKSPGVGGLARLDPIGALLLTVAIVLMMLPFIQFPSLFGAGLAAVGLGLMVLWVHWEKRLGDRDPQAPMVNLKLFALPSYTWNTAVLVLYFTGMPGIWAVVSIYIQQGLGHGALLAGVVTLPSAAMVVLLAAQVGQRVERYGPRLLMLGSISAAASMLMLAAAGWLMDTSYGSLWWVALALGVNGFSQALIIPSAQTMSMQDVPEQMAGAAGGVAQSAQRLFTSMGLAVVTATYFLFQAQEDHQAGVLASSLTIFAMMLLSVIAAIGAARRARRA